MELEENQKNIINTLSRTDSAGFTYFRCNEGIPFDWEMQPGIPKHPQPQQQQQLQHISPLTPPPAILSSNLRTPSMSHHPHFSKPSSPNCWLTKKLRFWKRNSASEAVILRKQTRSSKKLVRDGSSQEFDNVDGFAGADNKCLSDLESMAMASSRPFDSSFSMFFSSSSSSSGSRSPIRGIHGKRLRSCFPMHRSKIQVSIFARRD